MIKKIALLSLLALTVSCDLQYEGGSRLVVEGNLVDKNGNPLSGKRLEVVTSNGNDSDLISNTISDANGHVLMIFPKTSEYDDRIAVRILEDTNTLPKVFLNIISSDFTDYKFVIPKPVLHYREDVATLNLHFNYTGTNSQITTFTVAGTEADLVTDYRPDESQEDFPPYLFGTQYFMYKNQDVIIHYTLVDYTNNTTTEHTETVALGNDAVVDYTITY